MTMEQNFPSEFYESYHQILPRTPGFDDRQSLYSLFGHLIGMCLGDEEQKKEILLLCNNLIQKYK